MKNYQTTKFTTLLFIVFTTAFFCYPFLSEGNVFGSLEGLAVKGTITAQGQIDRNIDFSIHKGVLEGTVTATRTFYPRSIIMSVKGSTMHGTITSKQLTPRIFDFAIKGNSISGTAYARTVNINPRLINLVIGKNTIQGVLSTDAHSDRHILIHITESEVIGTIKVKNFNTRFINLTFKNNILRGTVTANSMIDRNIYFVLSHDSLEAVKFTVFFLLFDLQFRSRSTIDLDEHTALNLNTNLNLP